MKEKNKIDDYLKTARTPEQDDSFWDGYTSEVMERVNSADKQGLSGFMKYLIPVAAAIALFVAVNTFVGEEQFEEQVYSATLDFMLEEYDAVLEEQLLDPLSLYAAAEVLPDQWDEQKK